MKRYEITIKEIGQERRNVGRKWVLGAGDDGGYGYAPEVEMTVNYEREIYAQTVDSLDLMAVVLAINGKID